MTTQTLRATVAASIAAISPAVNDQVVATLVTAEQNKRADAIIKGMEKLSTVQRERTKLANADVVTYNADGSKAAETFTKGRLDEIAKLDKQINKLVGALDKAIDSGDMGDLYNIAKGGGDQ